jgi:hypothetical protein
MFVYFHWSRTGGQQHVQAFHKADKAAEYVINQIEALAIDEGRNLGLQTKKKAPRGYAVDMRDQADDGPFDAMLGGGQPVAAGIDWGQFGGPVAVPVAAAPVAGMPKPAKKKEEKKIPVELEKLRDHMDIAKKDKSFDNAIKAIQLYEDFLKYALNAESAIHTLTDLKIVE